MKTMAALVGINFRPPETRQLVASLPNGEPLTLIREPTNKFDRNAVQVWARGKHIGYLKGSQNQSVAMAMDAAITAAKKPVTKEAKLAIDGGKWPLVEFEE